MRNALENPDKLLDRVGWHILALLQENARLSYTEIGKQVGLSDTGVADRIRRMEDAGILRGYRADIDYAQIGVPVLAFVRVNVHASPLSEAQIEALIQATPTLVLAESTVKWHLRHLYGKLQACNRTQAVARARALGLLSASTTESPPFEG